MAPSSVAAATEPPNRSPTTGCPDAYKSPPRRAAPLLFPFSEDAITRNSHFKNFFCILTTQRYNHILSPPVNYGPTSGILMDPPHFELTMKSGGAMRSSAWLSSKIAQLPRGNRSLKTKNIQLYQIDPLLFRAGYKATILSVSGFDDSRFIFIAFILPMIPAGSFLYFSGLGPKTGNQWVHF